MKVEEAKELKEKQLVWLRSRNTMRAALGEIKVAWMTQDEAQEWRAIVRLLTSWTNWDDPTLQYSPLSRVPILPTVGTYREVTAKDLEELSYG